MCLFFFFLLLAFCGYLGRRSIPISICACIFLKCRPTQRSANVFFITWTCLFNALLITGHGHMGSVSRNANKSRGEAKIDSVLTAGFRHHIIFFSLSVCGKGALCNLNMTVQRRNLFSASHLKQPFFLFPFRFGRQSKYLQN